MNPHCLGLRVCAPCARLHPFGYQRQQGKGLLGYSLAYPFRCYYPLPRVDSLVLLEGLAACALWLVPCGLCLVAYALPSLCMTLTILLGFMRVKHIM